MSFLDFAEIKASNPIEDVALKLGLNLNKNGKTLRGKCPVCESSGDRNLAITPEKGVYYCFTDGKGGDVIALVAHVKGIGAKEAAQWLSGPVPAKEKTSKGETPTEGFKPLSYLEPDHPAVLALGIEPDDAERIGCGFAPRGMMKGTVAFPIRSTDGKLLGYIGTIDAKVPPKWNH
jgi:hypothetical protein